MSNDVSKAVEMRSDLYSNGAGEHVVKGIADPGAVMESRLMAQPRGGGDQSVSRCDDLKPTFHYYQSVMSKQGVMLYMKRQPKS